MGLVDRLLRRKQSKRARKARAAYDGAARTRRTDHWRAVGSDPTTIWGRDGSRLRNVSRDMLRNDAYAAGVAETVVNSVVGSGIIPSVDNGNKELIESVLKEFCDTRAIDADGMHNLYGLQRLAMRTVFEAGEVIIRRRQRRLTDRLPVPFQIQVLEPEYLDTLKDGPTPNGNTFVQGIEFDRLGRRVAYWLFDQHPASMYGGSPVSRRVDARSIVHMYRVDRPGQVRGLPWLAPVVNKLQGIRDYQDAQLTRQRIAACFAAFIYDNNLLDDVDAEDDEDDNLSETLQPGVMEFLPPGKDVKFTDPPDVGGYKEVIAEELRSVAVGQGLTYEAVSGDLSDVNFSSARMGRIGMDRNIEVWQDTIVIPMMCERVGEWILEMLGEMDATIKWRAPRKFLVDPAREIPALVKEVKAGLRSRRDVIRSYGVDPETVMEEIKIDLRESDALNRQFDTDPPPATTQGDSS